jgi:hypothetical protein
VEPAFLLKISRVIGQFQNEVPCLAMQMLSRINACKYRRKIASSGEFKNLIWTVVVLDETAVSIVFQ